MKPWPLNVAAWVVAGTTTVGSLNNGVACQDGLAGTGYVMYSEESIHIRFTGAQPSNADNFICTVVVHPGSSGWHLAPAGAHTCDRGISATQTECEAAAEQLAAATGNAAGRAFQISAGTPDDSCLDTGWGGVPLGCSVQSGGDWAARYKTGGVGGDGCTRWVYQMVCSGTASLQWSYDTDDAHVAFTPLDTDLLVAAVDFTNDLVTPGSNLFSTVGGIAFGYASGDLGFHVNRWGDTDDAGEIGMTGSFFQRQGRQGAAAGIDVDQVLAVGKFNNGVACQDGATGSGYVMYSAENVHSRFSSAAVHANNDDHFVCVVWDGSWQYDTNDDYVAFTPAPTDLLVAQADFSAHTATLAEGADESIGSPAIHLGYARGDLVVTAGRWAGANNPEEFHVSGSYIMTSTTAPEPEPEPEPELEPEPEPEAISVEYQSRFSNADFGSFDSARAQWADLEMEDPTSGYCTVSLESTAVLSNSRLCPQGSNSDIASNLRVHFAVCAPAVWEFQLMLDTERGGGFAVDGIAADFFGDLWGRPEILAVNLTSGWHTLEVVGFEACCDGPGYLNYRILPSVAGTAVSSPFTAISVSGLNATCALPPAEPASSEVDCVGSWGNWTNCSEPCGGGNRSRIYSVISAAVNFGAECQEPDATEELGNCNAHVCPPEPEPEPWQDPCARGVGLLVEMYTAAQTPSSLGSTSDKFGAVWNSMEPAFVQRPGEPPWLESDGAFSDAFPDMGSTNNFMLRWRGKIFIAIAGSYTFQTTSDDGSMLYIDEETGAATFEYLMCPLFIQLPFTQTGCCARTVVDNDGLHGVRARQGTVLLSPGAHDICILFFERGGHAMITASVAIPGGESCPHCHPSRQCPRTFCSRSA